MCKKKYSLKQYKKIARQVAANRNDLALVQIGRTVGEYGVKGSVTSTFGGDTKWNQNAFLMEPVSIANLHNNKSERNFWCCTKENGCWSAVGASAESEARKFGAEEDQTILEGSVLIYRSGRNRYLCSGKS